MSTDQEWEDELKDVEQALNDLKGMTVLTYPDCDPNLIFGMNKKSFFVRRKQDKKVSLKSVLDQYAKLRESPSRQLSNEDPGWNTSNGAFRRAVLLTLSTVEAVSPHPPTIRYEPKGLPVHLKPRGEWPCPKSSRS